MVMNQHVGTIFKILRQTKKQESLFWLVGKLNVHIVVLSSDLDLATRFHNL